MFPILQLGPLALQLPGLFLLAGVWLGTWLIEREAPRHNVSVGALNSLVFYGLIAGIVGARLAYASRYFRVYAENPLSLFSLTPSTLAPGEGILVGLAVVLILGQRRRLPFWRSLDALAPSLAAFAVLVGIAVFLLAFAAFSARIGGTSDGGGQPPPGRQRVSSSVDTPRGLV